MKWGVTPNVTLNATVNPDFSQVEADAVQLDVNTQFALFFPETRPFFLEGSDLFRTARLNLLHTRQVVQPDGALKISGKSGRHAFGLFSARDETTTIILPGSLARGRACSTPIRPPRWAATAPTSATDPPSARW